MTNDGNDQFPGFFPDTQARHFQCNACKEECEKYEDCDGVVCLDQFNHEMMEKSTPASCMGIKKANIEGCTESSEQFDKVRETICWKQPKRKYVIGESYNQYQSINITHITYYLN